MHTAPHRSRFFLIFSSIYNVDFLTNGGCGTAAEE